MRGVSTGACAGAGAGGTTQTCGAPSMTSLVRGGDPTQRRWRAVDLAATGKRAVSVKRSTWVVRCSARVHGQRMAVCSSRHECAAHLQRSRLTLQSKLTS
jgi:hypothetical protein